MKRKYADRPNWKRVLARRMIAEEVNTEDFKGHAVLICIDKVREALWVDLCGKSKCVADDGYSWLTLFVHGQPYVLTAMFDKNNCIAQWYIDICRATGFTEKGVPWYDDLYLDIIIDEDGNMCLIDEDDLQLALKQRIINVQDYDFAYLQAKVLMEQIRRGSFSLLEVSCRVHEKLLYKINKQDKTNQ